MVRRQMWQALRFKIFESARHFRIESNRDVQFESNLEASQVPSLSICLKYYLTSNNSKMVQDRTIFTMVDQ